MVVDPRGGVVPRHHGVLRAEAGEGYEVLGLRDVHGLPVHPWAHPNHGATRVAERDRVDRLLYRPVLSGSVLCHRYHTARHSKKMSPFFFLSKSLVWVLTMAMRPIEKGKWRE